MDNLQNTGLDQFSTKPTSSVIVDELSPATLYQAHPSIYASASALVYQGEGLKAEYYDNIDFTNLKVTRIDPNVDFIWGNSSPDPLIGADTFSARRTGQVEAEYDEVYNFYTSSDDGVRLWVNNQLLIDQFVDQSTTEHSGSIALIAGQKYDIKLEYYENGYDAVSQLSWSSASQTKEIIPQSQLYSQANTQEIIPQPQLYSPALQTAITIGSGSSTLNVNESDGAVSIALLRSGDLSGISTVKYATFSSTATVGVDYGFADVETSGTITFEPGQSSTQVFVPINDNSLAEPDETFSFVIDQPEGATLGVQRTIGITIQDNDSSDIEFTQPVVSEKDGSATVTVTRGNSLETASVSYTTVDGTGTDGFDYKAVCGTLNFLAGEITKTISIDLVNDPTTEPNETFTLKFSNAVGVTLSTQETTITITDDDPGNFVLESVASGLTQPTSFGWSSDNKLMFIAQKNGLVRVLNNGTLSSTPFIDISGQVNDTNDRGLLSLAVHPDFGKGSDYVYLLFTYDPPETNPNNPKNNPDSTLDNPDLNGNRAGRLIRVTADPNTNYTTAIAGSEVVLLGNNSIWEYISHPDGNSTNVNLDYAPSGILNKDTGKPFTSIQDYLNNLDKVQNVKDFIATDSESHSVGTVGFGTDGSLFVSLGDGTSYNGEDPRAIRVQDIDNLSGKLLRIDPITGDGLSSNPFYNGDSDSNRSKVYNYGLRNPFRFTIDEETNTPYIGDVGWFTWEELNVGIPGANFGWPYFEGGIDSEGNYVNIRELRYSTLAPAQAFYNSGETVTAPTYAYKHFASNSIIVGDFYTETTFPSIYQDALFFADSSQGTIDAVKFDDQGKIVVSVQRFASSKDIPNLGVPVQISVGEDGNLYYASLYSGEINRFRPV
ncbi:PQQ-dependent sugar dehydrogenase [Nostoc sp. XA010]|uniref:Calx-beta domain-containing protein n=1 Tax=Nostoc sp. XA010 TaxID=2780407 RepID=UPI001E313E64|nr:Calx-beta domain-containing protein [Nostoc sp. XA010]MCC5661721.1 PQQ-dependent sugar dehydrogenase [Nostoc sp. XA010]